jgi:transcriptional regulator with XRE-family HTH domain
MTSTTTGKPEASQADEVYVPVDAAFSGPAPSHHDDYSLGERLRRARTASGLTLDSASARTRINRDYLEALEAMDPRGLPSRAYCVGYLRTYAQVLGLDAVACVDEFKAEIEVDAGRATPTAPQERREIRLPRGMIGAVLIVAGVIAAGSWYGNSISRTQAVAGVSAPMEALLTDDGPMVDETQLAPPSRDTVWAGLPAARSTGGLILEAAAAVSIEVRDASGRILVSRRMDPGDVYRAPDEAGLTVSASNAGAILVRAGGRPLGALGEAGTAVDNVSAAEFVIAGLRADASN